MVALIRAGNECFDQLGLNKFRFLESIKITNSYWPFVALCSLSPIWVKFHEVLLSCKSNFYANNLTVL